MRSRVEIQDMPAVAWSFGLGDSLVEAINASSGADKQADFNVIYRQELLKTSVALIQQSPWFGVPNYLDQMTGLLVQTSDRTPADARAVARMQLKDLNRRLGSALTAGAGLDAYTRAHLEESRARIDKALSAGLEAERR